MIALLFCPASRLGDVLAGAQDAQALLGSLAHLGGIRAEEERRDGQYPVAPDAVVQRNVVSLHPPTPRLDVAGGVAEDGPGVPQRVPQERHAACFLLQRTQHLLVLDDQLGLPVGVLGQAGGHQCVGQSPLLLGHVPQHQAVPVHRRVIPEDPLAVVVAVADRGLLRCVQAIQQRQRRPAHLGCRLRVRMGMIVGVCSGHAGISSVQRRSRLYPDRIARVYAPPIWSVKPNGASTPTRFHLQVTATTLGVMASLLVSLRATAPQSRRSYSRL